MEYLKWGLLFFFCGGLGATGASCIMEDIKADTQYHRACEAKQGTPVYVNNKHLCLTNEIMVDP